MISAICEAGKPGADEDVCHPRTSKLQPGCEALLRNHDAPKQRLGTRIIKLGADLKASEDVCRPRMPAKTCQNLYFCSEIDTIFIAFIRLTGLYKNTYDTARDLLLGLIKALD